MGSDPKNGWGCGSETGMDFDYFFGFSYLDPGLNILANIQ